MIKIAHLGDIHLRNNTRHEEYKIVFRNLYKSLAETKPDIIVIAGDLFHQKTELTGNSIVMMADFLDELQHYAPVYIIVGNHDYSKQNRDRVDSIEAVVSTLDRPRIYYSKNTVAIKVFDYFHLYLHSDIDQKKFDELAVWKYVKIGVYHGVVNGAKLDNGFELESEVDLEYFKKQFDYTLLGDIHKRQFLDKNIAYCGSLIQQDYTENPSDHGYLLWTIEDKENFKVEEINIPNPYTRFMFELSDAGIFGDENTYADKSNCTAIVKIASNLNEEKIDEFVGTLKSEGYGNIEIKREDMFDTMDSKVGVSINENYYDINVQEKTLRSYLWERKVDDVDSVLALNRETNEKVKIKEQVLRNQNVDVLSIEIENLFSYKEKQTIDISDLSNAVIGINGKNASGKSSIPDILLWILYGKFNRSTTKSGILNNEATKKGTGTLYFKIGDWKFRIARTINVKKQGTTAFEVLDGDEWNTYFEVGDTKRDTDKLITKFFGTYDDLVFTNIASQDALTSVIENKKLRKDVVNRFLGLDIFGECYTIANKEKNVISNKFDELKSAKSKFNPDMIKSQLSKAEDLKKYHVTMVDYAVEVERQFAEEVTKLKSEIIPVKDFVGGMSEESIKEKIVLCDKDIQSANGQLNAAPAVKEFLQKEIGALQTQEKIQEELALAYDAIKAGNKRQNQAIKEHDDIVSKFIANETHDLSLTKMNKSKNMEVSQRELSEFSSELFELKNKVERKISDVNYAEQLGKHADKALCKGVGEWAKCELIIHSVEARDVTFPTLKKDLEELLSNVNWLESKVEEKQKEVTDWSLGLDAINKQIKAVEDSIKSEHKARLEKELQDIALEIERYNTVIKKLNEDNAKILELKNKLNKADLIVSENKNLILQMETKKKNLEIILQQFPKIEALKIAEFRFKASKEDTQGQREKLEASVSEIGRYEGLLTSVAELQRQIDTYESILKSYEIYLQAYDTDGIPHNLVTNVIVYLQNKVNSILQMNNAPFKVSIDVDEDKELYLFKVLDGFKVPIDFCSGMEKTIISVAFRVAYSEINSLCKLNLFVIDEAFTTFDSDNIQHVNSIFKYLSKQFDKLLIISHLDSIKEYYDITFQVEKTEQGSKIERI